MVVKSVLHLVDEMVETSVDWMGHSTADSTVDCLEYAKAATSVVQMVDSWALSSDGSRVAQSVDALELVSADATADWTAGDSVDRMEYSSVDCLAPRSVG